MFHPMHPGSASGSVGKNDFNAHKPQTSRIQEAAATKWTAYAERAAERRKAGKYREAIEDMTEAIKNIIEMRKAAREKFKDFFLAHKELRDCSEEENDETRRLSSEAEEARQESLTCTSLLAPLYNERGELYLLLGAEAESRDAEGTITYVQDEDGRLVNPARERYTSAWRDFEDAVEISDQNPVYLANLAISYAHLGEAGAAVEYLGRAIALDKTNAEYYFNHGRLLLFTTGRRDSYEKAIEDFNRAIELGLDSGEVYFERGRAHLQWACAPYLKTEALDRMLLIAEKLHAAIADFEEAIRRGFDTPALREALSKARNLLA